MNLHGLKILTVTYWGAGGAGTDGGQLLPGLRARAGHPARHEQDRPEGRPAGRGVTTDRDALRHPT